MRRIILMITTMVVAICNLTAQETSNALKQEASNAFKSNIVADEGAWCWLTRPISKVAG